MLQYIVLWCIVLIYSINLYSCKGQTTQTVSRFALRQIQLIAFKQAREEAMLLDKFLNHDQENQPTEEDKKRVQELLQKELLKK